METARVLIIEDNQDAHFTMRKMLTLIGYKDENIFWSERMQQIHSISKYNLELIITDLTLPDSSRDMTFGLVQKQFPEVPIIVLTGAAEPDLAIKTLKQGASDYLVKGRYGFDDLKRSVQYAVERKAASNNYKHLFKESPVPMLIFDRTKMTMLAVNTAAHNQYEYSYEEFKQLSIFNLIPKEQIQQFTEAMSAITEKYSDIGTWQHCAKGNKPVYVHLFAYRTRFERKDSIILMAMDVSRQIETETALKDKDAEKENILDNISDGFMTLNYDWQFTYMNKACERMLNITRERALGNSIWDLFPEARQSAFFKEYSKAISTGKSVHFEEYYAPLSMWTSVNAYPTRDGLAIYFLDITEKKKIQDKLINDEQRIRAIINNTKDIIWSIDKELNIIDANNAFWERLKYMTGKNMDQLTPDDFAVDELSQWSNYIARAFKGETFKIVQEEVLEGNTVYAEISFNPIPNKDNEIVGVSCFSRDITHQVNYQHKIESQNKLFKEIAWLQSHKVRNHVATIMGLAMVFNDKKPDDEDNKLVIDGMMETAQKLDEVIREINNKTQSLD